MPFGRFLGRGTKQPAPAVREEADAGEDVSEAAGANAPGTENDADDLELLGTADSDADSPEDADEIDWRRRAAAVLPTGASTGSKRSEALYGDAEADAPTHFVRALGCRVIDAAGRTYVDCTMALGSVALGYAEPNVTRAVADAAAAGNVTGLSAVREVEVAERLCAVIPCAEMVQFLKTGAEATAAAVRLARVHTGRDCIVGCGYFGWLDWSSSASGVPAAVRNDYRVIPFDDIPALEQAVADAGDRLAAVVLEPVMERLPSPEWAKRARALCDAAGAVLIFDEVKTGFRLRTAGYQDLSGVTPDLASFGKAMANGYPLAAVVGRRDLMEGARKTWISSTLASESTALAAAAAVLDWHEQAEICESLASIGHELGEAVRRAIQASGIDGVSVDGIDPMWFLRFQDPGRQTRFLELAAQHGVLFKLGPYNFAALGHDEEAIAAVEAAASDAFVGLLEEEHGR